MTVHYTCQMSVINWPPWLGEWPHLWWLVELGSHHQDVVKAHFKGDDIKFYLWIRQNFYGGMGSGTGMGAGGMWGGIPKGSGVWQRQVGMEEING
jgi:hypothetical protein